MTRTLCSGRPRTKAVISSRSTCGFWLATYSVYESSAREYTALAARGSIALGISRLLTNSSFVTCAALAKAASVAALSPQPQTKQTLSGAMSCTAAAALLALAVSTTAGRTS